jgi:hypothetical protein
MGVTPLRKSNGAPDDPRSALREAIAARAEANAEAERHRQAIERTRGLVADAERRVGLAGENLEAVRGQHAQAIAVAAAAGQSPKANGQMRAARMALADAEDEAQAARAACEHLKADRSDDQVAQAENVVLVQIAKVIAPVCEELLAEAVRRRAELLALTQTLFAMTSEESAVPRTGGEVQRAVAADARRAPLEAVRERVLRLNLLPTTEELTAAQSAVAPWTRWRTSLRNDADAPLPEPGGQ